MNSKARGRRFEIAGFGAYLGLVASHLSWWVAAALIIGMIVGGVWIQWRAERKHKAAMPSSSNFAALTDDQWRLFNGELAELVERYGGSKEARREGGE